MTKSLQARAIWGVGPAIFRWTGVWFALTVAAHFLLYPRFVIGPLTTGAAIAIGATLVVIGTVLYLLTWRHLLRGLRAGQLVTDGPFRFVRHPLYAIGVFLLTPGVCVMFRSWLVLTTPVVMFVAARVLVAREEASLANHFGERWNAYRDQTGALAPRWR